MTSPSILTDMGLSFMNSGGRGPSSPVQRWGLLARTRGFPPRKHMSTREGLARLEEIPTQDDPARQLSAPLSAHDSAERAVSRMHFRGGGCFSGSCSYYHGNTVDRNLP